MSLASETRKRCPELADFLEFCCTAHLSFDGPEPIQHSAANHMHLWALEFWADQHAWIDLDYRCDFVGEIFRHWRGRLTGLPPYQADGYRVYLYEDLAPTVSVVAATPVGCPYGNHHTFVSSPRDVMARYVDKSWQDNFACEPWAVDRDRLLKVIEKNKGSISKPSANAVGLSVGALRILIEQMGLEDEVNALRKHFKRRPAKFREDTYRDVPITIYESHWPAGY